MEWPRISLKKSNRHGIDFCSAQNHCVPNLHRYCRSLTGTAWDAEDQVQDTLLRAFAKLGDRQPQVDNPKAYLFQTAGNLWVDQFRRMEPLAPAVKRFERAAE